MRGTLGYYPKFAELLSKHLTKRDRSASWLANCANLHRATVNRWLREGARPRPSELIQDIADCLGLNNNDLQKLLCAARYALCREIETKEQPSGTLIRESTPEDHEDQSAQVQTSSPPTSLLSIAPEFAPPLIKIFEQIEPLIAPLQATPLADHGLSHLDYALAGFEALLKHSTPPNSEPLNAMERFISAAAILLHNIGLCFQPLSRSTYLTTLRPPLALNSLSSTKQFALLTQHWHELSSEMIIGSVRDPNRYPSLGLTTSDPYKEIADLIRLLPTDARAIPTDQRTTAHSRYPIRFSLLVALVKLALSLEIAAHEHGPSAPRSMNSDPVEVQMRQWFRYYTAAIEISPHLIRTHWRVPSLAYFPHIANAYHDYFVRRWSTSIDALVEYGWVIFPRPANIILDEDKTPLPAKLLALLQDKTRLAQLLKPQEEFLGDDELPMIHPYYYGALLEPLHFSWHLAANENTTFQVTLEDRTTSQTLWHQAAHTTTSLPYPADAPPLILGHHYRWYLHSIDQYGIIDEEYIGDFWLLDPATHAALTAPQTNIPNHSSAADQLTLANLYITATLYGPAAACLQQAIALEPSTLLGIQARRQLADLYERIANHLKTVDRINTAEQFFVMAKTQYIAIRQLCEMPANAT